MTDLEQVAATIAAGIASRQPQHRPRDNQGVAAEALAIARCLLEPSEPLYPDGKVTAELEDRRASADLQRFALHFEITGKQFAAFGTPATALKHAACEAIDNWLRANEKRTS